LFQSAPHFSSEANSHSNARRLADLRFNPRLTSAARRTCPWRAGHIGGRVSIRASLQQRGERVINFPTSLDDLVSIRASLQQRGEHAEIVPLIHQCFVSIRASLQQRGELGTARHTAPNDTFQSAPHFSSEANGESCSGDRRVGQFQSAPHFSSEAN